MLDWFRNQGRRPTRRVRPTVRPALEVLEDRTAPAVLTVNTLADDTTPDATLSLREAIAAVNAGSASGLSPAEQAQINTSQPFGTNDTIQFSVTGTIQLGSELDVTRDVAIQGPGAMNLTVSGGSGVRVFFISAANATLDGLTIANSVLGPGQNGGGIWYEGSGTLTVSSSAITNNSANSAGGILNGPGNPGASFNTGTVNVVNCTLSGNQAGGGGVAGAIWNNGGTLNVTNSTIAGNISNTNEAGGIWNSAAGSTLGTTTVLNSTISGNQSRLAGGGAWAQVGTFNVKNTIIAGNTSTTTASKDVVGGFTSQGNNLVGITDGSTGFGGSDLTGTGAAPLNPQLAPLADYGGPTLTMALVPGSPAINAGNNAGVPATDQRGFARVANGTVDIGAFEAQPVTFTVRNTNDGGPGSLRQYVQDNNLLGGDNTITFAIPTTDPGFNPATGQFIITLTGGELSVTDSLTIDGPGAGLLAVSGNNASRVFLINGGTSVTLSGLTITGGNSKGSPEDSGFGGGILSLFNGALTLNDDVLTGNTASTGGGITAAFGSLIVNRTTVSTNSASQAAGLYLQDEQVVIDGSTISGNQAQDTGGLRFESDFNTNDSLTITNTTIANNTASSSTDSALRLAANNTGQTITATLSNVTISGNALTGAGGTGGIRIFAIGTVNATLTNTIVAGNTSGGSPADLLGTFDATSAHNLIGTGGNLTNGQNGNLVGVNNPLLAPPGPYGGPTQTMALLPGSPAIDAGTAAGAPATDQRGVARPQGAGIDIGAFESQGFTITVTGGDKQSATVNTAFAAPLLVTVGSAFGEPVQGGVVTFAAPADGASATFPGGNTATIDASGQASASATANTISGGYAVTATATGAGAADASLTNLPVIVLGPATLPDGTVDSSYGSQTLTATGGAGGPYTFKVTGGALPAGLTLDADGVLSGTPTAAGPSSFTIQATDSGGFTNTQNYTTTIAQASPTVTWANPADITYGTPLGDTQLDATADVPGNSSYTPAAGTVLDAGPHTLSVTFTPADTADYTTATAGVTLVVDKATPTLSWPSPVDITYGTALGGTQLDATASAVVNGSTVSVPGTFRYTLADGSTPALGAVLPVGQNQLLVSFTPSDTTDYFNAIGSTQLTVDQATLTATGVPAFAASLGTPFSGTVATFTNADPLGTAASYSAVIAWGDGSTSPAVITDEGDGLFAVSGSHTYLSAGTDAITVQINHNLGDTTSAAAHDTAAVSSDVVIAGAAGDTLEVMRTAGGGPGDVTYILNGGAPVSLHGVTSFTFVAGPGNATMIVDLANGGPIASGGAVSFSGGAGADTLDLQAAGLAVDVNSVGFNVGGQAVNFTGVAVTHIDDAGAVNTIAGPDTADRDAAFAGLTPQERFVQALYLDDLGRAGRRDELGYWVGVLGAPGGSAAVADGIMRSLEGRDHLVRSWYLAFLGRPAAGGEEVGWVNELLHGRPEEAVLGDILGGAEFLGRAQTLISSGSGDERFVRALYQVLLGRTPAGGEVAYWLDRLPQLGAAGVAQGFLRSAEYRTNLTESCYNVLLHRPSDAGRDYWVFSDLDGTSLRVGFEASAEFFAHG